MKIIISPAKSLNIETSASSNKSTQPIFTKEASVINQKLRSFSATELGKLQKISPKLAQLNFERNQLWSEAPSAESTKQAILAFSGDVYQGMQAENFNEEQISIVQEKIRILSGQYGILRPLDLIQAYRLEMGTKLPIAGKKDLYQFWTEKVTAQLKAELTESGNILINLASNEYFKVLDKKKLDAEIITPTFKDLKNGQYKMISIYAKKARGMMCRFVVENNISDPEEIKAFDMDGYYFNSGLSKGNDWIFTREH